MICNDKYPASLWVAPNKENHKRGGVWHFDASYPGSEKLVRYERVDRPGAAALDDAFSALLKLLHPLVPGGRKDSPEKTHDDAIRAALEEIRKLATPSSNAHVQTSPTTSDQ